MKELGTLDVLCKKYIPEDYEYLCAGIDNTYKTSNTFKNNLLKSFVNIKNSIVNFSVKYSIIGLRYIKKYLGEK
jgi:hypothetical protein